MSITPARKPRIQSPTLFEGQSATKPASVATDDFVDDLGEFVRQQAPSLSEGDIAAVKAAVRERWGGDRPFIARRAGEGRSARNAAIRADFQRGERYALLERRWGLGRRQLLRILGKE